MTKFTEKKGTEIVGAVRAGAAYFRAAESQGISRRTLHRWLAKGEADHRDGRRTKLAAFWQEFKKANSEVVAKVEKNLVLASESDWRAGAWFLTKRAPENYSDQPNYEKQIEEMKAQAAREILDLVKHRGKPETHMDLCRVLAGFVDTEAEPRMLPVPK